ncbi:ShlB/FhaC/HecB family hemolysin secretion/activation protein [Acinetobacter modestus]|uniref:ShlB/FhaC/HecB family hemolysin secretion/activation protein n=1 Tax=Acinetobacter modestus TaxID=1776740 RepID=UPI00301A2275
MLYPKTTLLMSMLSLSSFSVFADNVPNAGLLLQQQTIQQYQPQAEVNIEQPAQMQIAQADAQQQVKVEQIVITGNQSISTVDLHALVADAETKMLTLADLQQLTKRITTYYQQQGYPYSRAYLPVQSLKNGVVKIAILEAKYDRIIINNQTKISPHLIQAILQPLQPGNIIDSATLQQQLKLLNRLDGIQTRNIISAGRYAGTSDLTIDIQPTSSLTGYVGLDNYGNEYTHEVRLNAGVAVNNALGLGDRLTVDGMTSGNLNFGRLGYEATINGVGTRLGASYSDLAYELGKEYKALDATGTAQQISVWLNQPVLLNNRSEVILGLQYDHKRLKDDINVAEIYRDRNIDVGRIRLDASQYDDFAGGGLTQLGVATDIGRVNFKNAMAELGDQATAKTQGEFVSAFMNVSRLQNLNGSKTQIYAALQAQYSPDNLDSAQQFSVGGASNIAGYKNSALSGSTGYYVLSELRQSLYASAQNQLAAKIYVDTAMVKHQAREWSGLTGKNIEQISSAGFGLNWSNAMQWQAALTVGFPIGAQPDSVDKRNDVEAWLNLSKRF